MSVSRIPTSLNRDRDAGAGALHETAARKRQPRGHDARPGALDQETAPLSDHSASPPASSPSPERASSEYPDVVQMPWTKKRKDRRSPDVKLKMELWLRARQETVMPRDTHLTSDERKSLLARTGKKGDLYAVVKKRYEELCAEKGLTVRPRAHDDREDRDAPGAPASSKKISPSLVRTAPSDVQHKASKSHSG